MKRTIIIAASAVTLAAAGIAGSQISVRPKSPNTQLQMETASEIRQEKIRKTAAGKKEDGKPSCKRRQLATATSSTRYRQQARQPPMPPSATVRSVFPKGRLPTTPRTTSLKSTSPGQFRRTPASGCVTSCRVRITPEP